MNQGIMKKLDELERRAQAKRIGMLPLVDATVLFTKDDWEGFNNGDAETRERMRQEFALKVEALVAEALDGVSMPADPNAITAIVVSLDLPSEENA